MRIVCKGNGGYQWSDKNGVYFKGFIFDENETVLRAMDAIDFFSKASSFDEFTSTLSKIEESFSVIVDRGDEVWAAVDIERTMPIYYSADLDMLSDNADEIRRYKKIDKDDIDTMACLEMYGAFFISGEDTIYDQIKQIDYRNAICISGGQVRTAVYYTDSTPVKAWKREDALTEVRARYENAVRRALKVVGDRTVILSLSGGYDSRCLACTLKNIGFENVVCLAYGDVNSFEIKVSKRVADALGYPWYCVEYSDEDQLAILNDKAFFEHGKAHDYVIYLQNYTAVKKAKAQGMIPDPAQSVFMVGLVNDVSVGHYVPLEDEAKSYGFDDNGLANYLVHTIFARFELSGEAQSYFHNKTIESINKYHTHVYDYQTFVTAWDDLNLGLGHSRMYPKMNQTHEYFGYEWLMPFMDRELMQFWRSVPVSMRIAHNLFAEFVTEKLADKYGVGEKKIEVGNAKTSMGRRIKRFLGGYAVRLLYPLGIPLKRTADINNFAPVEVALYKGIKQKRAVKPTRAAIGHLMSVYCMEQRYGTEWYKKIQGMVK